MKRFIILFIIASISTSMQAQIKIVDKNVTVVGKIVPGMTYPNISKDYDNNYYLVNNAIENEVDLQVIKLGNKDDSLKAMEFFKNFIKNREAGAFFEIQDESNGYKYRVFKVTRLGQGGLRFECLDNPFKSDTYYFFIKNVNEAIEIIKSPLKYKTSIDIDADNSENNLD